LDLDSIEITGPTSSKVNRWKAIFPPAQWVPTYQARWLKDDLFAGITLAAYAIPVALAYATLAGLPPQVGVYGYLLGGLGYAMFGSSRHLAIGPTSAISLTNLTTQVVTVGELPSGLPNFSPPMLRIRDVDGILPLAFAALLLSYIESVSAARTFATKYGYKLDVRQELLGIGSANLAVAFGQGYPVAGGLSQSAVNEKAGAKTPLSLIFASITLAFCLLFFTGFLRNLPKAVLAAIVSVAITGLINLRQIGHLWRVSRLEFTVAAVALVGVLLLGILKGVVVAAIASILLLIQGVARPHVAFLGRIPGTRRFSDLARHQDNEQIPEVLVFRVESGIVYFNVEHILRVVLDRVEAEEKSVRLMICDLSTSPAVDLAGVRMILDLHTELAKRGIVLRLAEAHASVRDLLRIEGAEGRVGRIDRFAMVADVIEHFQKNGV
jgi:SulP family sulfate permease